MQHRYTYWIAIGERAIRMEGRNCWEAAHQAAIHLASNVREGQDFFAGLVDMEIIRSEGGNVLYSGTVDKWMETFRGQRRNIKKWEKLAKKYGNI